MRGRIAPGKQQTRSAQPVARQHRLIRRIALRGVVRPGPVVVEVQVPVLPLGHPSVTRGHPHPRIQVQRQIGSR